MSEQFSQAMTETQVAKIRANLCPFDNGELVVERRCKLCMRCETRFVWEERTGTPCK